VLLLLSWYITSRIRICNPHVSNTDVPYVMVRSGIALLGIIGLDEGTDTFLGGCDDDDDGD
jgi:hypothetical protein